MEFYFIFVRIILKIYIFFNHSYKILMWIDDSSISCIHCTQFTIKILILSYILCGKEDIKKILIILKPQLFSKVRYIYY
jgi:hypothetical protein